MSIPRLSHENPRLVVIGILDAKPDPAVFSLFRQIVVPRKGFAPHRCRTRRRKLSGGRGLADAHRLSTLPVVTLAKELADRRE